MENILEIEVVNKMREASLTLYDWKQEEINFIPLEGCWSPQEQDRFNLDKEINNFFMLAPCQRNLPICPRSSAGIRGSFSRRGLNKTYPISSSSKI